MKNYFKIWTPTYVNDNDAFIPELWANESLAILEENMVVGNLVHRDFSTVVANFGDVVNTRRPANFTARRKTDDDNVTIQDAITTNVAVRLDQHIHVSFMIKDGEQSKSFKELADYYMRPAMIAQARFIDRVVLGQTYQFLPNRYGHLNGLTSTVAADYLLGVGENMNNNLAPEDDRNLVITPRTKTQILSNEQFLSAEKLGDGGTALRNASIGHVLGMNVWMGQNTPYVNIAGTVDTATGTSTNVLPAGTTGSITVSVLSYDVAIGSWVTIFGDDNPHEVTARTFSTNTTAITFSDSTNYATLAAAVVTAYKSVTVNLTAGYAAGWSKPIVLDGFTSGKFLQVGQLLSFGNGASRKNYTVIYVESASGTAQTVTLDRPLESAIADDAVGFTGPAGSYNLAFNRTAIALVTRPLALPMSGVGAKSATVSYNNLGMRATLTYNGEKQGLLVTLDVLAGVKLLDVNQGAILLA